MDRQKKANALKWILGRTKRFILPLIFISLIGIITSVLGIWLALLSKDLLDIATNASRGDLAAVSLRLVSVIAAILALNVTVSVTTAYFSGKLTIFLKTYVINLVVHKKYSEMMQYHSGELLNRVTSDVGYVADGFVTIIPAMLSFAARFSLSFGAMLLLFPQLTLIMLVLGCSLLFSRLLFRRKLKEFHKKSQQYEGMTRSFFLEIFKNIPIIKIFDAYRDVELQSGIRQQKLFNVQMRRTVFSTSLGIAMYLLFSGGYFATIIWGAFAISGGTMTFGTLAALLQLINQMQSPIQGISSLISKYYAASASAERLIELEAIDSDPPLLQDQGEMELLTAENICFSYRNGSSVQPAIRDLSFRIARGEIVGFRGQSGVGKSTLFRLLAGLLTPDSGRLEIEAAGGGKYRIDASARGFFAYASQEHYIFSGTLKENILFGNHCAVDEQINEVLRVCALDKWVRELENGLDTKIGENGTGVSEGQMQRLEVARAILSGAQILLLDEFTSSLDEGTELIMLDQIRKLNKTILIVSHKESTLNICDRIVQID